MGYIDGFVLPVPKRKLEAYRRMARMAGRVWRDHGAVQFRECTGDDLDVARERRESAHLDRDGPHAFGQIRESIHAALIGCRDDFLVALRGGDRRAGHSQTGETDLAVVFGRR